MTDPDPDDWAYWTGYAQGVADTGARLIAVVAAELGHDHPITDRMVERLGQIRSGVTERDGAS